jgi:toxin secretion/phage lysis holin
MEKIGQVLLSIGAAIITFAFGGWTGLLTALLAFEIIDYITGCASAWKRGEMSSKVGTLGLAKKVLVLVIVAVGHLVDGVLGAPSLVMDAVIYFYMSNELLSITENVGEIGVPLPGILEKAIAVLKEKSEGELEGNGNEKRGQGD